MPNVKVKRKPPTAEEYITYHERFCNWGRWGDEDQLGTLNFITDKTRRYATSLVREGRTVSCGRPLATQSGPQNPNPAHFFMQIQTWRKMRKRKRRNWRYWGPTGAAFDYIGVFCHGYVDTHIDALCHVYSADGRLYNDRSTSQVTTQGAQTNSIEHWRDGILTRGVLYDIPRLRGVNYVSVDQPVQGWELEDAAQAEGIVPRQGDAVLVHFGRNTYFAENPDASNLGGQKPGLNPSVLEFLYEYNAALLGSEFDEAPFIPGYPNDVPIHAIANPYMGLPTLWSTDFEHLARVCEELDRWEFQFITAPLIVVGGTGSVVNPIAIF